MVQTKRRTTEKVNKRLRRIGLPSRDSYTSKADIIYFLRVTTSALRAPRPRQMAAGPSGGCHGVATVWSFRRPAFSAIGGNSGGCSTVGLHSTAYCRPTSVDTIVLQLPL